jgi:hypothetical protein
MTAGLVEHSKELDQKIEFRLRHADASGDHGAVVLPDSFVRRNQLVDDWLLGRGQPSSSQFGIISPVTLAVKGNAQNLSLSDTVYYSITVPYI